MSLFISSINSGSNGNCYYIGNRHEAVLVDVGISCREVEKRMSRLGLSMALVKAVFISHEHTDHIRGVETLAKKFKLPVFITPGTLRHGGLQIDAAQVRPFGTYKPIVVGNLEITAFPKLHDASDPHSFLVQHNGTTVGVFTDIGSPCEHVISNFKKCDAAFLEANYDDHMLETGNYPFYLKKRIRGGMGHLSNDQALWLYTNHRSDRLSHLVLSHLSRDNNSPDVVNGLFNNKVPNTQVIVASRYEESRVYEINGGQSEASDPIPAPAQMSLF